jgi:hypothetical protein
MLAAGLLLETALGSVAEIAGLEAVRGRVVSYRYAQAFGARQGAVFELQDASTPVDGGGAPPLPMEQASERKHVQVSAAKALGKQWQDYRLGDAVMGLGNGPGTDPRVGSAAMCGAWPHSIGCAYNRLLDHGAIQPENITALHQLVQERRQGDVPPRKAIVVHVRVGDGLKGPDCWHNSSDCNVWAGGGVPTWGGVRYAQPQEYYAQLMPSMPRAADGYSIVIVGVSYHIGEVNKSADFTDVSKTYIDSAVRYFEDHGYDVAVRSECDPDTDFAYMSSAHTFVQGGGGYSGLIAGLVEFGGGAEAVLRRGSKKCPSRGLCFCSLCKRCCSHCSTAQRWNSTHCSLERDAGTVRAKRAAVALFGIRNKDHGCAWPSQELNIVGALRQSGFEVEILRFELVPPERDQVDGASWYDDGDSLPSDCYSTASYSEMGAALPTLCGFKEGVAANGIPVPSSTSAMLYSEYRVGLVLQNHSRRYDVAVVLASDMYVPRELARGDIAAATEEGGGHVLASKNDNHGINSGFYVGRPAALLPILSRLAAPLPSNLNLSDKQPCDYQLSRSFIQHNRVPFKELTGFAKPPEPLRYARNPSTPLPSEADGFDDQAVGCLIARQRESHSS